MSGCCSATPTWPMTANLGKPHLTGCTYGVCSGGRNPNAPARKTPSPRSKPPLRSNIPRPKERSTPTYCGEHPFSNPVSLTKSLVPTTAKSLNFPLHSSHITLQIMAGVPANSNPTEPALSISISPTLSSWSRAPRPKTATMCGYSARCCTKFSNSPMAAPATPPT